MVKFLHKSDNLKCFSKHEMNVDNKNDQQHKFRSKIAQINLTILNVPKTLYYLLQSDQNHDI
jgi:hypothetical protein